MNGFAGQGLPGTLGSAGRQVPQQQASANVGGGGAVSPGHFAAAGGAVGAVSAQQGVQAAAMLQQQQMLQQMRRQEMARQLQLAQTQAQHAALAAQQQQQQMQLARQQHAAVQQAQAQRRQQAGPLAAQQQMLAQQQMYSTQQQQRQQYAQGAGTMQQSPTGPSSTSPARSLSSNALSNSWSHPNESQPAPMQHFVPEHMQNPRYSEEELRRQAEEAEAARLAEVCPRCESGGGGKLCKRHEKERLSKVCEWCELGGTGPNCPKHEPKTALTQEQVGCHKIMDELMSKNYSTKLKDFYSASEADQSEELTIDKVAIKLSHTWNHDCEYTSITEFASDLRKIAMAGYNKFGPASDHAQNALTIEKVLDQKVAMLGAALREKASLAATNALWAVEKGQAPPDNGRRSRRAAAPTPLIKIAEQEWTERERQLKKQREQEAKEIADRQQNEISAFSEKFLKQEEVYAIQAMWEIPSMGVLLYLLQEPLRIVDFTLTALEIGILQPQWSLTIASIFVGLLTPSRALSSRKGQDKEQREKSLEYDEWHSLLVERLDKWYEYRQLVESINEAAPMLEERTVTLDGHEPFNANELPEPAEPTEPPAEQDAEIQALLDVLGDTNPLKEHRYHALPVFYRIRILYTLVSSMMSGAGPEGVEAHKYIGGSGGDAMLMKKHLMEYESADMRGQMLGEDSAGDRYFYCKQFDASDFRIYRLAQKITLKQRQEAKRAAAAAPVKGGRKRAASSASENGVDAQKSKKGKKAVSKPKAKAKPKKAWRQGFRRSSRGKSQPELEPPPEAEEVAEQQQDEEAHVQDEPVAEMSPTEPANLDGDEKASASSPAPASTDPLSAEVNTEISSIAASPSAPKSEEDIIAENEAAIEASLVAERNKAMEWTDEHCLAPELREQFDIICDEMNAEGAWGEFVYRMGISKVRALPMKI